jgi:hypothetical protein
VFENVSEHLDEAVRLAERCPEKYQIPCFEALIRVLAQSDSLPAQRADDSHLLNGNGSNGGTNGGTTGVSSGSYNNPAFNSAPNNGQQQSGERGPIFLDQHQIPEAFISRVYHLDGNSYRIIVKDLKEKTNSKKQVKLALLLGIGGLLASGQPVFSKERLIEACREYGAYDAPNFASHMKKQRDMFISHGNDWSLTVPAQQRAAEAIKELAN